MKNKEIKVLSNQYQHYSNTTKESRKVDYEKAKKRKKMNKELDKYFHGETYTDLVGVVITANKPFVEFLKQMLNHNRAIGESDREFDGRMAREV